MFHSARLIIPVLFVFETGSHVAHAGVKQCNGVSNVMEKHLALELLISCLYLLNAQLMWGRELNPGLCEYYKSPLPTELHPHPVICFFESALPRMFCLAVTFYKFISLLC